MGGAENVLRNLVRDMDRTRFENVVVSMTTEGALGESIRRSGTRVVTLGMPRGVPDPRGVWRLRRILRDFDPHILQTWLYHADLLGTIAKAVHRKPSLAWNVRCANMDMTQYRALSGITLRVLARVSRAPAAVVINSEAGRNVHEGLGYHPRKWELIPNGFDAERFRPDPSARQRLRDALGLPHSAFIVGLVARLDPMKDHTTFMEAARMAGAGRDMHFVLVGEGVEQLGSSERVHPLGRRNDVQTIVPGFDVACSASKTEGMPNAVGEAMACAIPCVATDAGDTRWLLGDGGMIVPTEDPRAFAAALGEMYAKPPDERRAIGERARQRILDQFTLDAAVRRYEHLYTSLVADRVS